MRITRVRTTPDMDYVKIATWVKWSRPFIHFWKYCEAKLDKKNIKILDIGCGPGYSLADADPSYVVIGIEITKSAITKSPKNVRSNIIIADAQSLPIRTSAFDVISAFDLLEHLKDPDKTIKEVYRALKPRGVFIFTTPSRPGVSCDPTHINERFPHEWLKSLKEAGFRKVKMFYCPLLISIYLLTKLKITSRYTLATLNGEVLKILYYLETPLRKIFGLIYGKIGHRLYVEAVK